VQVARKELLMSHRLLVHVKGAAGVRGDPKVPDKFILEALRKIDDGDVEVKRYPGNGTPVLREVYAIAASLEKAASSMH
jgi:hypothetical protein